MSNAFDRLNRVLKLEQSQGYQNKAVIGGMRQFAAYWVDQARVQVRAEADKAMVEQMAELLMGYDQLSGPEARAEVVNQLMGKAPTGEVVVPEKKKREPKPKQERKEPVQEKSAAKKPQKKQEQKREHKPNPPKAKAEKPKKAKVKVDPDPEGLAQDVTVLKGVGKQMSEKLSKLGAHSVKDLLFTFPRRYDDYSQMASIKDVTYGDVVTVIGTIWETRARRSRNNSVIVQSVINDGTASVTATWFGQQWLADKLKAGTQISLSGKVEQYLGRPVFNSPQWEPIDTNSLTTGRIVPIYPLTDGLYAKSLRKLMSETVEYWAPRLSDPVPESIRKANNLMDLQSAVSQIHFPESQQQLNHARRRLVFDELFMLQLGMFGIRRDWQSRPAMSLRTAGVALGTFLDNLPFTPTGAQSRVIKEIVSDMSDGVPMNRLLQGDVGAGKTIVAAAAMVQAVDAGAQAALMAPTEILAEQHYRGISDLLPNIEIRLLTGSMKASDKKKVYADIENGTAQLVIGTHALIQDAVTFNKLALAVIDEQHRFGVDQRGALRDKGVVLDDGQANPHLLVMTATPIPRTLALSLHGDLDLSVLDEMPPGRQEIKTRWIKPSERERAYAFVRGQVEAGRQAFIICPLVEESDKIEAKAAVEEHERLSKEIFPQLNLGLIHGKLKPKDKEEAMRTFSDNETNILVSTSVVEVGVDVPNSTVMLIEGANRFGLAQLHQFRGRVGRGEHQSYCLLIADNVSGETEERLKALEDSNDGFVLAEKDLEIRGPGQFFGRAQSGLPELQMASLTDVKLLELARKEAKKLFETDDQLEQPDHAGLREQVEHFWNNTGDIS